MSFMTWNDSYSVGVKTIDQQHTGLFAMVNELHTAMMSGHAKDVVGSLLGKLVKYTLEHFAYEERMMGSAKYPQLAGHHTHHVDLTRQVEEFMARYKRGDATVNVELLQFLSNWLTKHILHEDKQYAPWLKSHGVQ
ncbi:MAG: bacteriohemerythrin [Terracidiphilus sp.]